MNHERTVILVVDDEPANLALLRKLLGHHGYDVVEALDSRSALAAIEEHEPELVGLDIIMPEMDGIEVCQRLRSQPARAGLPILLLTALDRPRTRHAAYKPARTTSCRSLSTNTS